MKSVFYLIVPFLILVSCINNIDKVDNTSIDDTIETKTEAVSYIVPKIEADTCLQYEFRNEYSCQVNIFLPEQEIEGSILLLHGWNLPSLQWCDSTEICKLASESGLALIIPDLQLCNYPIEIYPETLEQYRKYPTLTWITDTLLPQISGNTGLLKLGQKNFVAGISTGGRGATLLAFNKPDLFTACASLSGDFDITAMQDEFLYKAWFGPYDEFAERWENECFAFRCEEYLVPTYIGHGKVDNVSPVTQSKAMYDSIRLHQNELTLVANFPDSVGHNYMYWKSESEEIIKFFKQF